MVTLKCLRCDASWVARVENPVSCPRCKSPYWNRERKGVQGTHTLGSDVALAPFRKQVEESGITDEALDEMFQEARRTVPLCPKCAPGNKPLPMCRVCK